MTAATQKLSPPQIETIIDKLVPMIASDEDQGFFRGILSIKLEECKSSGEAAFFINKLLKEAGMQ